MNDPVNLRRRKLLLTAIALPATGLAASIQTPSATEGPFYPSDSMRFQDVDNDLVKIEGQVKQSGGEIVHLSGRVLDAAGKPVSAARVEIWQCDVNGRYLHRGDSAGSDRDPGFQGFGTDITDVSGHYRFRTIKPVAYTGRTPHIHVKVWHLGRQQLTTQFYLAGHATNERDWLYRKIDKNKRELVSMDYSHGKTEAVVDIVI